MQLYNSHLQYMPISLRQDHCVHNNGQNPATTF